MSSLNTRRRSGSEFASRDGPARDTRRNSASFSGESSSQLRQLSLRKASVTSSGDSPDATASQPNRHSLDQVPERTFSAAEKRAGWSQAHHDSGVLTSFESSRYSSINNISSIDALLDERQVDAEELLVSLGFAPAEFSLKLEHRLPGRFLKARTSSRSRLIERFVTEHREDFRDLLTRRRFLRLPSGAASFEVRSDPASSCASDPEERAHNLISEEGALRLLSFDLPQRFRASVLSRCGRSGLPT